MASPFDYTKKKLVSYKVFKRMGRKEMTCRRGMKSNGWKKFNGSNPYEQRYGANWEQKFRESPAMKKVVGIHEMIDHIIKEGNRIFADTKRKDTWMIYHDHLKIFWEKETIEYMKSLKCPNEEQPDRTWFDRVIKLEGTYSDSVHPRYKAKLPGDSPELMPLDCHLFADIKEALARNIALSFWLPPDHPAKYSAATPNQIYKSLCRTIGEGRCPPAKRIEEDICRIRKETLQRIIDAEGTYIEDKADKPTQSRRQVRHGVRLSLATAQKKDKSSQTDAQLSDFLDGMLDGVHSKGIKVPVEFEDEAKEGDDEEDSDCDESLEVEIGVDEASDDDVGSDEENDDEANLTIGMTMKKATGTRLKTVAVTKSRCNNSV